MENQENNNLSELEQLKQQYETLKEQFDQQEILNDRLMKSSIKRSTDFYKRYRTIQFIVYPLMVIIGLLTIKWLFGNILSLRLFWVAFCVICFVVELWMTRMVRFKTLENNDLLTLSNHARSFKKLYAIYVVSYVISIIILVSGFLLMETGSGSALPNWRAFLLVLCLVFVIVVIVGIAEIRYKTRPCDEIIRQIEAAEPSVNKKTGFDRKQKWFCVAMFVAYLCLAVWAYMIVASHLKLPPMWHTVKCERAANDLSTEGSLAIWEIYADTLVAEEDVPTVMAGWHVSDSLVVMKSDDMKMETGLDKENDHVWKNEDDSGCQMRLYALKKTSPEGPAISSVVMGGKPIVAMITANYQRKFTDTETVPMIVFLTPEAGQLWYQFTTEIAGHRAALVMDGIVIQDWKVMCGLDNNSFFITRDWSSKEELKSFCERLIRQ